MDAVLSTTLQYLFSFGIMIVVLFVGLNWLKKGELFAFLKVRASRGGKLLACIHSVNDVYFKVGYFDGNEFKFTNRAKKDCTFAGINPDCVYTTMGVQAIDIDEVNSCLWTRDGAIIQGNDPVHVDHLIKRALESPEEKSMLYKILIICLIILIIATVADTVIIIQVKTILSQTTLAHVITPGA